ncbi:MAG: HlyD family efflux transporter periplasmic adaptor subunit [Flavobacteriaceae bacterium]|nr:HlyD family efflux transporter periplasmic adaptor subunit [Flavobacteriaceae bacterium]
MDKKIEKKQWNQKKTIYLVGGIVVLILFYIGMSSLGKKTYKVDASKISVKEVTYGNFQDIILIEGDVEPINLVLVNTLEGGSVEEIFIEDGIRVTKETPLLRLTNPAVTLNYMNQETAIIEQINNLRNLKLSLEKVQRDLAESLIDSENNLANEKRAYKIDSIFFKKGIIARNDYIDRKASYKHLKNKRDFMNRNVTKSEIDNKLQIKQINTSIALMARNLKLIHNNIDKMLVKAPVTGMLSSFSPVIGESYTRNQNVAKIDVQSGFKIKGQVSEYYLSSVKTGQLARFTLNGKLVNLKVSKVLPEVINRQFEIELVFVETPPKSITIGQSIQVRLELAKAQESLLLPRGNYFQSSGGQYVFVLDGTGEAHKRKIKLGSQNPTYYQVLDGINEGEKFISSSYDAYKEYETIIIKK